MLKEYNIEELNYGRKVYDFMRWDYLAFTLSTLFLIVSVVLFFTRGFNWGLDFTGGTVIELTVDQPVNLQQVRESLVKVGYVSPVVQNFGSSREIMIRLSSSVGNTEEKLGTKIIFVVKSLTKGNVILKRIEFVGPSVGNDLAQSGGIALLAALICILIYVGFRFDWRLSLGAVLALAHDVIVTLGVLSLFQIEIDLTIVASLMSVIGYSLNDSIVVSDRIRENFRKISRGTTYDIINVSITQTLSRTVMTAATTLMVISMLYLFGGEILKGFSLTMLIGIFIGTISSIYIASALSLKFGMKREHMLIQKVEKEGADQASLLP